jgi:hypothetical protein
VASAPESAQRVPRADARREGAQRTDSPRADVRIGREPEGAVAPGRSRGRSALVFVKEGASLTPRIVRLGASNYDYSEVLSGLKEGDEVALLAAAALQAQRQQALDRFRGMTGGGVPGMQRQPTTTAPGATGGAPAGGGRP